MATTAIGSDNITRLTLRQPDDWHVHLRDGAMLAAVVNHTARQFARAIVMPNLKPPITTVAAAESYRQRIRAAVEPGLDFTPLMTFFLIDNADPAEISAGFTQGVFTAAKLYPAHATTNSSHGVTAIAKIRPTLEAMQCLGMPLLIHGEVTDPAVDIFDREQVFIERCLIPLLAQFPALRVVLEHITTRQAAEFIAAAAPCVAATITAHHLLLNRNALFVGGMRPHHYCLPVLKREHHRQALLAAATGGNPKFFLGTDSAPHAREAKESACGCAGIYTAHAALELYAEAFEEVGALDRLEAFASFHGADFYRLARNRATLTLEKRDWLVAKEFGDGRGAIVPFRAGQTISWQLREPSPASVTAAA